MMLSVFDMRAFGKEIISTNMGMLESNNYMKKLAPLLIKEEDNIKYVLDYQIVGHRVLFVFRENDLCLFINKKDIVIVSGINGLNVNNDSSRTLNNDVIKDVSNIHHGGLDLLKFPIFPESAQINSHTKISNSHANNNKNIIYPFGFNARKILFLPYNKDVKSNHCDFLIINDMGEVFFLRTSFQDNKIKSNNVVFSPLYIGKISPVAINHSKNSFANISIIDYHEFQEVLTLVYNSEKDFDVWFSISLKTINDILSGTLPAETERLKSLEVLEVSYYYGENTLFDYSSSLDIEVCSTNVEGVSTSTIRNTALVIGESRCCLLTKTLQGRIQTVNQEEREELIYIMGEVVDARSIYKEGGMSPFIFKIINNTAQVLHILPATTEVIMEVEFPPLSNLSSINAFGFYDFIMFTIGSIFFVFKYEMAYKEIFTSPYTELSVDRSHKVIGFYEIENILDKFHVIRSSIGVGEYGNIMLKLELLCFDSSGSTNSVEILSVLSLSIPSTKIFTVEESKSFQLAQLSKSEYLFKTKNNFYFLKLNKPKLITDILEINLFSDIDIPTFVTNPDENFKIYIKSNNIFLMSTQRVVSLCFDEIRNIRDPILLKNPLCL